MLCDNNNIILTKEFSLLCASGSRTAGLMAAIRILVSPIIQLNISFFGANLGYLIVDVA